MTIAILMPVKSFNKAKSRLSSTLTPIQRTELVKAMAQDVLSAAQQAKPIDHILVVSRAPEVTEVAKQFGAETLNCPLDTNLNTGINTALKHLAILGYNRTIILHADLPLIQYQDIDKLAHANDINPGISAVKAHMDGGTTALSLPLPSPIPTAFGQNSFDRHSELAKAHGVELTELDLPRACFDIDTKQDLNNLQELITKEPKEIGPYTLNFLKTIA